MVPSSRGGGEPQRQALVLAFHLLSDGWETEPLNTGDVLIEVCAPEPRAARWAGKGITGKEPWSGAEGRVGIHSARK